MNKSTLVGAALGALGMAMLLGGIDRHSAVVTEKHEREAFERKSDVKPEDRMALRMPIPFEDCDATMRVGYFAHAMDYPRCYLAKGAK